MIKFEYFAKDKIYNTDILENTSDNCDGIFLTHFDKVPYWIELIKNPELSFFVPDGHIGFHTKDYQLAIEQLRVFVIESNTDVTDWLEEGNFEFIPTYIQDILNKLEDANYEICGQIVEELIKADWFCDFDLSASLFDLRPMTKEEKEEHKSKELEVSYISGQLENIGFGSDVGFSIKLRGNDGTETKWLSLTNELMKELNLRFK